MDSLRSVKLIYLFCAVVLSLGCGDGRVSRVPVSGQVLIDGKPLQHGTIRFLPPDSRASAGNLDKDGRFTLSCYEDGDGAVLGTHRVEVVGNERISSTQRRWHAPKRYADSNLSGLQQDISGSTDSIVVNLTWDGGKPFVEIDAGGAADTFGQGDVR